ncbi:MAG TPA: hypothetical protein VK590_13910 [Saprospiraceae bacterium]|nr:hypothetical protein [Saprospiraceae bacterium]
MIKRFLILALLTILYSCGLGIDKKQLERDAETIAFHRCQLHGISNKLERVTIHAKQVDDSLKLSNLNDTIKRRLVFYKAKRRDDIDYSAEIKRAYLKNNEEEEVEFKKDKYSSELAWKKLNVRAEELLKKKIENKECDLSE